MRRAPFAVILLATSTLLVGQKTSVQTAKTDGTAKPSVMAPAAKPKLTEQQKRGLNLLESAEGAAGGFEAPSRIVAYTQIARVYQTSDKKKAIDLLQQAYDSLQTLQLDSPNKAPESSGDTTTTAASAEPVCFSCARACGCTDRPNGSDHTHRRIAALAAVLRKEQKS